LALVRQHFGEDWRTRVKELNASDERGIHAVREQVKTFAQLAIGTTQPGLANSKAKFRVIILDEADSMTHDAQAALRRIMEEFVHLTRFIVICNYVSKIIGPLHSRCSKFRFSLISHECQKARLLHICDAEKVKVAPGSLDSLIKMSKGDMRFAVTLLQTASDFYGDVNEQALIDAACGVPESAIQSLIKETQLAKTTDAVLNQVRNFLQEGYSGQQVMDRLLAVLVADLSIPDLVKAKCALLFSQTDERLTQGCDEELQLFAMFAAIRPLLHKG